MNTVLQKIGPSSGPLLFVEQSIRRNQIGIVRSGPDVIALSQSQSLNKLSADAKNTPVVNIPEPPKAVIDFFTSFHALVKNGASVETIERESYFYLPTLLTWLDQIDLGAVDPSVFQLQRGSEQETGSSLWNAFQESEQYIVETDQYVVNRLGESPSISNDMRLQINDLWLQRYLLQVLVRMQEYGEINLQESEKSYLIERLWNTAHAAGGLMLGVLPEPSDTPLFNTTNSNRESTTTLEDEDREWLEDAANDPVI